MTNSQNENLTLQKPLRLWPAVVILVVQSVMRFVLPIIKPEFMFYGVMAVFAGTLGIIIWWLFFSRAPWKERIGAFILMIAAVFATSRLVDVSIAKGAMGMLFYVLAVPALCFALVVWAVVTRNLTNRVRRVSLVLTILLALGVFTLIRTGGFTGEFENDFAWRWSESPEELLLKKQDELPAQPAPSVPEKIPEKPPVPETQQSAPAPSVSAPPNEPVKEASIAEAPPAQPSPAISPSKPEPEAEWPGFRGPGRNSTIHGVHINTDWSVSPPVEMWRRQIGPGWSSFAVRSDLVFTQEQRGEEEIVACYNMTTGKPVWRHSDPVRFWESNAGAGPRGTPTLHEGQLYSLGATGIMNALNASDGAVVWSRNAAKDTETKVPGWGFSSSPLVVDDIVIVATAGRLVAYDRGTGELRWLGPKHGTDYSSPHLFTIDGTPQVLLLSGSGATSVVPANGKLLWEYALPQAARIVQPAVTSEGDLLINEGEQRGLHRVTVAKGAKGWTVQERWNSNGLKPYFSDFVVHKGYAYGFDGSFLSCIDLNDGQRKWKGGRYGSGQLVLLADQDLLLVVSEKGQLALVGATADQYTEFARSQAIQGKTWNHPVLVKNVLLVRNGVEMAAFRLPAAQ